jgi:hypothetical protein
VSAQPASLFESLDLSLLAARLKDWRGAPSSEQAVNELLVDTRDWRHFDVTEIERRLRADDAAVIAALELLHAEELPKQADSDFVRLFTDPLILKRLVWLALDADTTLPQTITVHGATLLSGLHFLRMALRWAQRFGQWTGGRRRALATLNVQHPFATVILRERPQEIALLLRVIEHCGIQVLTVDQTVPRVDLDAHIAELLGLPVEHAPEKQFLGELVETGGTRNSLFVVRAIGGVDGYDVRGLVGPDLGLIIDIGDREVSAAATAHIEELVIRIINEDTELSAEREGDGLKLRWANAQLEAEDLGRIIHSALKSQFVLGTISVSVIFDPLRIGSLRPSIYSYREERDNQLRRRSDENAPLIACRACRRYAPFGFCLVSPERPPCCGRSYDELATLAQLTTGLDQLVVERGVTQDRSRGRFVGADKLAALLSGSTVTRLHLHGLSESPQVVTAIPQCIAWVMDEVDLVGVVSADYAGRTPDGKTFHSLLTRAVGRQQPGIAGIAEEYVLSSRFLSGEGGLARVGWMNSELKARLKLRAEHILTENECTSLAGLKELLAAGGR